MQLDTFEKINKGFNTVFIPQRLSIGLVIPIEEYASHSVPRMENHLERLKLAEDLGFSAAWLRDVPLHVPTFGDAGQTFDPFSYLGFLAGQTSVITLGIASVALPLHHPMHVAKSAATLDQLTQGRFIMGIASGDRAEEYPAMNMNYTNRGQSFRDAYHYIRKAALNFPIIEENGFGKLDGTMDILPKPFGDKIPMLVTGHSQQNLAWIAEHGDGWMYYPRNLYMQEYNIQEWRTAISRVQGANKPFMQPLYIDLMDDDDFQPVGIHLGIRTGIHYLKEYLVKLQSIGVNHVALNLRFNANEIESTLTKLAKKLLPYFHQ